MSSYMLPEALLSILSCLPVSLHKPHVCMVLFRFNLYHFECQVTAVFISCMEQYATLCFHECSMSRLCCSYAGMKMCRSTLLPHVHR